MNHITFLGNEYCPPVDINHGHCSGVPYLPIYHFRECSCDTGYAFESTEEKISLACLPSGDYNQKLPDCICKCDHNDYSAIPFVVQRFSVQLLLF